MTDQLLATNIFNADGVKTDWQFNFSGVQPDVLSGTVPYLYPADVKAMEQWVDEAGVPQSLDRPGTLIQPNEFRITGAPVAIGRQVKIYRSTEIRFPLVDFRDRQTVSELDLDLQARQGLFVAMEVFDAATIATESAAEAEQTSAAALVVANTANATANDANATAANALTVASSANTTAGLAQTAAAEAVTKSDQALAAAAAVESLAAQAAADALAAAGSATVAQAAAEEAVTVAGAVDAKATTALSNSATALSNSATALSTANAIDAKATTALADSATALATANGIADTAATALTTANAAVSQANTATSTANSAVSTATAAAGAVAALDAEVVKTVVAGSGAGVSRTGSEVTVSMLAGVPLFSVMWWSQRSAIPAGYAAADGQTLSRTAYPDAWAGIAAGNVPTVAEALWQSSPGSRGRFTEGTDSTNFRLPDYNGKASGSLGAVFLRGDGALSSGTAGAIQLDAFQDHHHPVRTGAGSATVTPTGTGVCSLATLTANGDVAANNQYDEFGADGTTYIGNASLLPANRTAAETRPLNVTGCWVIRLFGAVVNPGSADAAQLATDLANLASRVSVLEGRQPISIFAALTGTLVDFGGIPSWATKLTLAMTGMSTNGASGITVRVGDGTIRTTDYSSQPWASTSGGGIYTNGFPLVLSQSASNIWVGTLTLTKVGTRWVAAGLNGLVNVTSTGVQITGASPELGVLDTVRLTTVSGTDVFDAGTATLRIE